MTSQPDFESLPFLTIDDQPLSWQTALGYLWLFGQLRPVLQTIVSQHIIYQEIKQREDLAVTSTEFEQSVIDFRLQQKLSNPQQFQEWLGREGLDYSVFQNRMLLNLKLDKLATQIAEPQLNEYFEQRKSSLDQIELSCFIALEEPLAIDFKTQLLETGQSFETLGEKYANEGGDKVTITRRSAHRQQWPQEVQNRLELAKADDIIGPVFFENRWCIFQVQNIIPPVLEGQLKRALEGQIFKEWLTDRLNQLKVQLVTQPVPNRTDQPEPQP
jgi:hypothetical protein